ncbi:MAG: NAD-binding protein, partial [Clostridia bacterium]|nr:NAD-binding protein [Clostridia bacterium]
MKIIIAGCGKMGTALTRVLIREGHDVTVIDSVQQRVNEVMNTADVQGICGNAADCEVLEEAQAEKADLFIA